MRKPRYMEELLAFIFICLGGGFVVAGLLSWLKVLTPKESSAVQNMNLMGLIFGGLGLCFVIASVILRIISRAKHSKHAALIEGGMRQSGTVEKVYIQYSTQYGRKSPYRIVYSFSLDGRKISRKSCYVWETPEYKAGDAITVFVNEAGESTIEVL